MTKKLTHKRLLEVLDYKKETGLFIWKISPTKSVKVGDVAGTIAIDHHGMEYVRIGIDNLIYRAHRLCFFYIEGRWPRNQVDHIDLDGKNNKFNNLRKATHSQNQRNASLQRNNTSGFKGVSFARKIRKWKAQIIVNGKNKYLGVYITKEAAYYAYCEASKKYHKEFGRIK